MWRDEKCQFFGLHFWKGKIGTLDTEPYVEKTIGLALRAVAKTRGILNYIQ